MYKNEVVVMTKNVKRILQVDDEPDITYIVEFVLSSGGFEVTKINDSTKAIEELCSREYALLILDLMMPKMSGFQVLTGLREVEKLKDLPVLILSSRQLTNEETDFLNRNDAEVMSKPFEPSRLLEKVREIVTEQKCTNELQK